MIATLQTISAVNNDAENFYEAFCVQIVKTTVLKALQFSLGKWKCSMLISYI